MAVAVRPGLAEVVGRLIAGVITGYALAAVSAVWLSFVLPMPRADAVATGMLVSFAVYAVAIIYAFAARSVARVWFVLSGSTIAFGLLSLLMRPTGGI